MGEETPCNTCKNPVLFSSNREAWQLYSLINRRFIYDHHALPLVFEIVNPKMTRGEAFGLLEKLCIIHDVINEGDKDGEG